MTYSTNSPPSLVTQDVQNSGPSKWIYRSADSNATVDTTGYITNGGALGMKVGDLVDVYDTANTIVKTHQVLSVSATYPGAVNLSDGTTVGGSTDGD